MRIIEPFVYNIGYRRFLMKLLARTWVLHVASSVFWCYLVVFSMRLPMYAKAGVFCVVTGSFLFSAIELYFIVVAARDLKTSGHLELSSFHVLIVPENQKELLESGDMRPEDFPQVEIDGGKAILDYIRKAAENDVLIKKKFEWLCLQFGGGHLTFAEFIEEAKRIVLLIYERKHGIFGS